MGASFSWFAVRGKTAEAVLGHFGLKKVGNEYRDTPLCGGLLPSGWYLVIHGRREFTNDEARGLSSACEVIACFVEEHVMVSRAACWEDGEQVWSVNHDAQEGDGHLDVEGSPPPAFEKIRDRLMNQQEEGGDVDYLFNIPVDLAKNITGYSHEDSQEITFDNFVKVAFFQRVFGR